MNGYIRRAIDASLATVFMLPAVPCAAAGILSFDLPMPSPYQTYVRPGRGTQYDVARDGRLLLLKPVGAPRDEIVIVVNWVEELKRLMPTK